MELVIGFWSIYGVAALAYLPYAMKNRTRF